ncbi:bacterio-opsin activator domain-containing protein [Haloarcula onubensis]|uniref:GAF domain-containing protein n=1 Tax=Haloarcula onubensis TaxID=2950539 RepID=A0ABU2FNW8_9EURY|nr:bacterio-opsin activator domain-containing protein [Halomicroarcula sp. S3CR25-11]MDS0281871.1 GAF domain-containing protein [Halomicroarcula sp. S3CR25-11]
MNRGHTVLVCGDDEERVAETAAGLDAVEGDFDVRTATARAGADSVDGVDCVVSLSFEPPELVTSLRAQRPALPVVVFADGPPERVREVLADATLSYVRPGGDAQYVVLAHRIESVASEDGPTGMGAFDRHGEVIEALDDGVYALDDEGEFIFANEALAELTGYDIEELLGEHTIVIKDRETVELAESKLRELLSSSGRGEVGTTFELELRRADGRTIACEDHMTVLYGPDGDFRGTAGVIRDISERKRREELLSALQETSRSLMQAPSREDVAGIVAAATERVLGLDMAVVRLYDADERVLRPAAATDAVVEALGERPVYGLDEGEAGRVFASGETASYSASHELDESGTTVGSGLYVPVGVHGTLSVLSTEEDAFDDVDRQVVALLATNAAAACNRAKREQEVRETRERIATILDRINGLIENTVEVLVEATTREAVEAGVCAELAATKPYTLAWVGRPAVRGDNLDITEWSGEADVVADGESIAVADGTPGAAALADGHSEVVDDLDSDVEWVRRLHEADVASMMAVPLAYTDSTYGVLFVCSDQPDAFDDREQVVLEALGRAVANAINAIESGKILSADKVIELEFTVNDRNLLMSRLSAATGATLTSAGTVTQDDGSLRVYLDADGDAEAVLASLVDDAAVRSVTQVAEHEGSALFEITVGESLLATLVDHGAVPKAVTGEDGVARYTIELPYEGDAREVFSLVEDNYDGTDLVGYHEHERPVQTQQEFQASLSERFTDRQETALRTAYLGGFFEWPREVDGDELASAMDISRPTYHQHLRAAQQKVYEELFE